MSFEIKIIFLSILFFGATMASAEIGWRLGKRHMRRFPQDTMDRGSPIEAALFALLGLLLAFTFFGAASRFDSRRMLVVDEANSIGTAYLRTNLLPVAERSRIRQLFQNYTDDRINIYRNWVDEEKKAELVLKTSETQKEIWRLSVDTFNGVSDPAGKTLYLSALNQMIDLSATRMMVSKLHPPKAIYGLLILVALTCALFSGYRTAHSGSRSWMYILGFSFILALTFYVIDDMESPRKGFFRIDSFDESLITVRKSMD